MLVTLSGIVMLVSPQSRNAESPMLVPLVITTSNELLPHCLATTADIVEEPVIFVSLLQPENAEEPMLVTLLPIVTLVSPVQSLKAYEPIVSTSSGTIIEVNPVSINACFPIVRTLCGMLYAVNDEP